MKSSSQNLTVVFNGEIYNYQELREQMEREKKILFVTRSDTETLVNGLEAYGPAFVEQLRGMFAFAVWNEKKEELMLARDFFGIKPLFYTVVDGNFVFASEIKSILQFPGVPKKLNERRWSSIFLFSIPCWRKLFLRESTAFRRAVCCFTARESMKSADIFSRSYSPRRGVRWRIWRKNWRACLKNPSAAIWSVMWKWELSCPAVWIRVLLPCCPGQKWRLRWDFWMGTAATTRKTGPGRWPVCASFLSHAYYREKGVLGCASKGNVRPRRAQR